MTGSEPALVTVADVPSLPARPADGHKGTFGTVLVLAGRVGMGGAAILAARGALRAGAGLVQVGVPAELLPVMPVGVPMATSLVADPAAESSHGANLREAIRDAKTIVVGPGLGTDRRARFLVESVVQQAQASVVVDADALNLLAPLVEGSLRPLRERGVDAVLTPHPGEAARLLGETSARIQADRRGAVEALARRAGGVAVLKGAGTLVCDGRHVFCNGTGNPGLATGGSGDVLAGVVGALLAQGMDAFDAACLGVHVHGAAGDEVASRLSMAGLTAEDLPPAIARELRRFEPKA